MIHITYILHCPCTGRFDKSTSHDEWLNLQMKSRDQELDYWKDTLYSFVKTLDEVSHLAPIYDAGGVLPLTILQGRNFYDFVSAFEVAKISNTISSVALCA